ncbi:hypothetical protein BD779DRAFT_890761 [Infundibulicybe gibba]|nr:hypothetical protein BD779DRAFT_890761 [Infundibulicybe gibba]
MAEPLDELVCHCVCDVSRYSPAPTTSQNGASLCNMRSPVHPPPPLRQCCIAPNSHASWLGCRRRKTCRALDSYNAPTRALNQCNSLGYLRPFPAGKCGSRVLITIASSDGICFGLRMKVTEGNVGLRFAHLQRRNGLPASSTTMATQVSSLTRIRAVLPSTCSNGDKPPPSQASSHPSVPQRRTPDLQEPEHEPLARDHERDRR